MATTPPIDPSGLLWPYNTNRVVKNEMGQNEFLQLLVAQLQYQDPLEPVKDSDFVAQLAQFSSLEQLQSMSKALSFTQASALVGKVVVAEAYIDGVKTVIPGVVDGIIYKDGEYYAQIGDYTVKTSAITEVYDNELFKIDQTLMNASSLIGRTVTAAVKETVETTEDKDVDGEKVTETVKKEVSVKYTGIVTGVGVEDGQLVATLLIGTEEGGEPKYKKVPVASIVDISLTSTQSGDTFDYAKLAELIANMTKTPEQTPPPGTGDDDDDDIPPVIPPETEP